MVGRFPLNPISDPDCAWPLLPSGRTSRVLALLQQMEASQWLPPERLLQLQFAQLALLLDRCRRHVPYYKDRLANAGIGRTSPVDADTWREIPLLTKDDLRRHHTLLLNTALHASHGKIGTVQTSGSTGIPVKVRTTEQSRVMWIACMARDHIWHKRDVSLRLAAIRYFRQYRNKGPVEGVRKSWGPPLADCFQTGPAVMLNIRTPVMEQLQWLQKQNAAYLITYPSNAYELAKESLNAGIKLDSLREVMLFGETAGEEGRELCQRAWDVKVVDVYSANEAGYIALQCPDSGLYHVQSENAFVEILDDRNQPCGPGETGRVVVTPLINFALPLIRYEIGDYAEVAEPCPCGRGLPALRRILGRTRNMLTLPGGERYWPQIGQGTLRKIAPVTRAQFIQHSLERIEVRLVVERPLNDGEIAGLRRKLQQKFFHPFEFQFTFAEKLEHSPTGKFEEFKSLINDPS